MTARQSKTRHPDDADPTAPTSITGPVPYGLPPLALLPEAAHPAAAALALAVARRGETARDLEAARVAANDAPMIHAQALQRAVRGEEPLADVVDGTDDARKALEVAQQVHNMAHTAAEVCWYELVGTLELHEPAVTAALASATDDAAAAVEQARRALADAVDRLASDAGSLAWWSDVFETNRRRMALGPLRRQVPHGPGRASQPVPALLAKIERRRGELEAASQTQRRNRESHVNNPTLTAELRAANTFNLA